MTEQYLVWPKVQRLAIEVIKVLAGNRWPLKGLSEEFGKIIIQRGMHWLKGSHKKEGVGGTPKDW